MTVIAIITAVTCAILFLLLADLLATRKKIKAAALYGKRVFDIELPRTVRAPGREINKLSDEAVFLILLLPYFDSLNADKQEKVKAAAKTLKSDLKIDKELYERFIAAINQKEDL